VTLRKQKNSVKLECSLDHERGLQKTCFFKAPAKRATSSMYEPHRRHGVERLVITRNPSRSKCQSCIWQKEYFCQCNDKAKGGITCPAPPKPGSAAALQPSLGLAPAQGGMLYLQKGCALPRRQWRDAAPFFVGAA